MADDFSSLQRLLRDVSRSFHLTLRILPPAVRPPISLAYLLARATDTIADTEATSRPTRIAALRQLRESLKPDASARLPEGILAGADALPAERALLERLPACVAWLRSLPRADQELIGRLLDLIITGQIYDLEQFPPGQIRAVTDAAATDRYTYLVAGCVGEFWTRMCQLHLPGMEALDVGRAIRFGQGLQLVNILRDLPRDLRRGRCYLPVREPTRFLEAGNFPLLEPTYRWWCQRAVEHLDAGWEYTLSIPASQKRLRLACIWPIWIGLKTIARLHRANPLDTGRRVKVARREVYALMVESALLVGNDAALDEVYQRLRSGTGIAAKRSNPNLPVS